MADAPDETGTSLTGERLEPSVAGLSIDPRHAYFDQLVIVQCTGGLGDDPGGHPRVADPNQGFERVGEAAKVAPLFLRQFHGPIVIP